MKEFDPNSPANQAEETISLPFPKQLIPLFGLVVSAILIGGIVFLLNPQTPTAKIRDMMIIIMSLELLVLGITAILLIIQFARLINLFQNEIKPVLQAANETMNTIRGTTVFLSDSLVEPVVKINSYMAAFKRFMDLLKININLD
jgi:sulfite exporter TauE/SafE